MSRQLLLEAYPSEMKELAELLLKTNKERPSKKDITALRAYLHAHPQLWRFGGDMMESTVQKLVDKLNASSAMKESILAGYDQLQRELATEADTPLGRLLVQQVVLCWLQLGYVENQYVGVMMNGNATITQASFWERRLSAAQGRFLRATETLARVRRLNLPAVQVNIGQQQVNQVNQ